MGRRDEVISRIPTVTSRIERNVGARAHHGRVTDDQAEADDVRLFDRMLAAGLSIEEIEQHLTAGRIRLNGELVTDPFTSAPRGTTIAIALD